MSKVLVGGYCFICDSELNAEQADKHNHLAIMCGDHLRPVTDCGCLL
jgi:hypothetical protein